MKIMKSGKSEREHWCRKIKCQHKCRYKNELQKNYESTGVQEYVKNGRTWKDLEGLSDKQKGADIYCIWHGNALLIDKNNKKFRAEKWNRDEGPQLQRKRRDVVPVNEN